MANCGLLSPVTGESTGYVEVEDPTGASAEREGGFDPQPKAGRAQGEHKGGREVLARHGRTAPPAQPRGGPGGCYGPNGRPSQPSCMCSFDGI
jgi:hypothetical protein